MDERQARSVRSDEWSKVKALFDQALDIGGSEPRQLFVASIEPESTRIEVRRLLSMHHAESNIFDRHW